MADADLKSTRHETVMDVTEEQIARVYADAFMAVAAKTASPSDLVDEVRSIVDDVLSVYPALDQSLRSELVSSEEKAKLLDRIFGQRASQEVINFLKVLAAHGRLGLLRSIARLLTKLDAQRRGLTEVEVRVAMPLDTGIRGEIENKLRSALGREPVVREVVDPSLLAGIVIRVGDRVYDASVHTQLEHARRGVIDRITEDIESDSSRFMVAR